MQRPTSVTVFGVLNIVLGGLGLLGSAISAIALFAVNAQARAVNPMLRAHSVWDIWTKASLALGLVAIVLLIASGIGLLSLRPWGRSLAIGYAVYGIALGLISIVMAVFVVAQPGFGNLNARGGPEAAQFMVGAMGGAMFVGCIRLVYPALLWYYMTRPHVIAAFGGMAPETMWSPPAAEPWTPAEARNPFVPPRTAPLPLKPSGGVSESIVETFVPSQNGPALASYYLGIFSLIPCVGLPLGIAAICYGVMGLRRERANPAVRGGAHAWVGIICGSLFGVLNFLGLVAIAIVAIAGATRG
jgi:hypothetical protein